MNKPLLIYDGECRFCRIWVDRWRRQTGDAVDYAPYQEVGGRFPRIEKWRFHESVQYVAPDGKVTGGAKAVYLTLSGVPGKKWLLRAYERVPLFGRISEAVYHYVSHHRVLAYRAAKLFGGGKHEH